MKILTVLKCAVILTSIGFLGCNSDQTVRYMTQVDGSNTWIRNELKSDISEDIIIENSSPYLSGTFPDVFTCWLCLCSYYGNNDFIANCSDNIIFEFPQTLPKHITQLVISQSRFSTLNVSMILRYRKLRAVAIIYNTKLTNVTNKDAVNTSTDVIFLDLSHNKLGIIEDGSFLSMTKLLTLNLSFNKITKLSENMFVGLVSLEYLILKANDIRFIEGTTFQSLQNLRYLDMHRNTNLMCSNRTITWGLFLPLTRLEFLDIHYCGVNLSTHHCKSISELTSLTILYTDALTERLFSPYMLSLKNFTSLQLRGSCRLRNITSDLFQNAPYLTELSISRCPITHVSITAYKNLKNLQSLIIETATLYKIYTAFNDLEGLMNTSVKHLALRYFHVKCFPICILVGKHAIYLQHINLESLDLSGNNIGVLDLNFTSLLPKTLKELILYDNSLSSQIVIVFFLKPMINLEILRVSHQGHFNTNFKRFNEAQSSESKLTDDKSLTKSFLLQEMTDYEKEIVNLPPKLSTIEGSKYFFLGSSLLCMKLESQSLETIDVSSTLFTFWGKCTLPSTIRYADLSDNNCDIFNKNFFHSNSSLHHLNVRKNFLGVTFSANSSSIFHTQTKLQYLDISMNLIFELPPWFLDGLVSLSTPKVSDNKIEVLNLRFYNVRNLTNIDFSRNSITDISKQTRNDLDYLADLHSVFLDITENPLQCTCSGLDFMVWLETTKVKIKEYKLFCRQETGQEMPMNDISEVVESLRRQCSAQHIVTMVIVASVAYVVVLAFVGIMYKYRWRLRYLRNIVLMKLFAAKNHVPENIVLCKYDAYIISSNESEDFMRDVLIPELEQKRGHKLCIEDRDFMPGTYVINNIVSAIQNSHVTIPLVTTDLYSGQYVEYAIKMALMTEIFDHRSILHLCLLEPVPQKDMSHDLMAVMKSNKYTEYPPKEDENNEVMEAFWGHLSEIIGKNHQL